MISFCCARGRRFIPLSPAPPLPCEFPVGGSPTGAYLCGHVHGNKGTAPSIIRCTSKRWALVGGIAGDSPVPPETQWPARFASALVLKAASVLQGQLWCWCPLGNLGSAPTQPWPAPWDAAHPGRRGFRKKKRPLIPMLSLTYKYCLWMQSLVTVSRCCLLNPR